MNAAVPSDFVDKLGVETGGEYELVGVNDACVDVSDACVDVNTAWVGVNDASVGDCIASGSNFSHETSCTSSSRASRIRESEVEVHLARLVLQQEEERRGEEEERRKETKKKAVKKKLNLQFERNSGN